MIPMSEFMCLSPVRQRYVLLLALRWALFCLLGCMEKDLSMQTEYMQCFDGGVGAAAREDLR